jgi:O-antigen/teichoic acid export membrane protein
MVYASGDVERMRRLLSKAFKVMFGLAFLPLGFASVFGPLLAYAWTGTVDSRFRAAFWLVCLGAICRSVSGLSLVLYRVSGKAILDNLRQLLRIAVLLVIACFARDFGFNGTLSGLALAEFAGMVFMLFALRRTFHMFSIPSLLSDGARMVGAVFLIVCAGVLASYMPVLGNVSGRGLAALNLVEIGFVCALVAWPVLHLTGSVTTEEARTLLHAFVPRSKAASVSLSEGRGV